MIVMRSLREKDDVIREFRDSRGCYHSLFWVKLPEWGKDILVSGSEYGGAAAAEPMMQDCAEYAWSGRLQAHLPGGDMRP